MTFQQELSSWLWPKYVEQSPVPTAGVPAPSTEQLAFPRPDNLPIIVTFLRHCGCPFAEKTFQHLTSAASSNPDIHFVAVSHSSQAATETWLSALDYSATASPNVQVVVDDARTLYARWGLGVSSTWHVMSPISMWSAYKLGKDEGIWNRPTESGTRWQTAGSFAVDGSGIVRWAQVAERADDMGELLEGVKFLLKQKQEEHMKKRSDSKL
ncbi:hypothetical protein MMC17_000829 [Xylographa soralifera]|nr:hypothetical protein [Xylographa soralifera]